MKRRIGRNGVRTALFALLVAGVTAGVAYATIPDSGSGAIRACMLKGTGTIRLIDPALGSHSLLGHCTTWEKEVVWNAVGQPGPQGPQGLPGAKGDQGATGAQGATGPAGPKGDTGATGTAGATGQTGDKGDTGPAGAAGDTGPAGPIGDTGPQGPAGGIAGVHIVQTRQTAAANSSSVGWSYCPDDEWELGGGYNGFSEGVMSVMGSLPADHSWGVKVSNMTNSSQLYDVYVVCASAS